VNLLSPIDIYCERTAPGLFAELLNAASNLAFVLAAILLWRRAGTWRPGQALAVLVMLVGLAGLSFHTFANRPTMLLDVSFIAIYLIVAIAVFLRYVAHRRAGAVAAGVAGFVAFTVIVQITPLALVWRGAVYVSSGAAGYLYSFSDRSPAPQPRVTNAARRRRDFRCVADDSSIRFAAVSPVADRHALRLAFAQRRGALRRHAEPLRSSPN